MTVEHRRLIVVSTAHVSKATADTLNNSPASQWPCLGGPYGDYGWFFFCHEENDGTIPAELFDVMVWARKNHRTDNILLDCDADPVEGLPVFDW